MATAAATYRLWDVLTTRTMLGFKAEFERALKIPKDFTSPARLDSPIFTGSPSPYILLALKLGNTVLDISHHHC